MQSLPIRLVFIVIYCVFSNALLGQDEDYVNDKMNPNNENLVFDENIKSLEFHIEGLALSHPIIQLNSNSTLRLAFDDLDTEIKDYYYVIQHCNADWKRSELSEMDYIDGFEEDVIQDYDFSFNTMTDYTHYELRLPNQNTEFTKSGNYLIHIYEDDEKDVLVMTRRFMIVDPQFRISSQVTNTASVGKSRTHHEIDFVVSHQGVRVNSPLQEVKVTILQNGQWNNAITDLKPLFIREDRMVYDYQDKIVFPAMKEFRHIDVSTLRYRTDRVRLLLEDKIDKYHIQLFPDVSRTSQPYIFHRDLNGGFVIDNKDFDNPPLSGDYAWVHFYLERPYDEEADVYVVGRLSDWQLTDEFKMEYSLQDKAYYTKAFLKQGFYDYMFVKKGKSDEPYDFEAFEGNWYETENEYQILVYYRPFGARYDMLVATQFINSVDR